MNAQKARAALPVRARVVNGQRAAREGNVAQQTKEVLKVRE